MNKTNVKIWTAALRSGNFEQTRTKLARRDLNGVFGFCCLGVGCKVADIPGVASPPKAYAMDMQYLAFLGQFNVPPREFHDWLGIPLRPGILSGNVHIDWPVGYKDRHGRSYRGTASAGTCADLNDMLRLSFEQIADLIDYFGVVAEV